MYDCIDMNIRMLDRMYRKRLKEYALQGYTLQHADDEGDVRGEFVLRDAYLERFEHDVSSAAKSLFIASSDVHKRRVDLLMPCIEEAGLRGVSVQVVLPADEDAKPRKASAYQYAAVLLERAGARVAFRDGCPNLAIVDGAIVWYGGIAPFAFPRADEQVLRFVSGEVASELGEIFREGEA